MRACRGWLALQIGRPRNRRRPRKKALFATRIWRAQGAGGEPLWRVRKPACEIHPSTSAASKHLKQAAPANDPEFGSYPQLLLAKAIDSYFADELRRLGFVPGSRLFKACFGRRSAVRKVARSRCHTPKRLPSSAADQFPAVGQRTVFEGR